MTNEKSLIPFPSDDEIREILARTVKENPSNYPVAVLQIELARLMVKCLEKLTDQFSEYARKLEDSINDA